MRRAARLAAGWDACLQERHARAGLPQCMLFAPPPLPPLSTHGMDPPWLWPLPAGVGGSSNRLLRSLGRTLSRQGSSLGLEALCCICMARRRQTAFSPCGHLATCAECSEVVLKGPMARRQCPFCKSKVGGT